MTPPILSAAASHLTPGGSILWAMRPHDLGSLAPLAVVWLAACSNPVAREQAWRPAVLSPPAQFLADRETDLVAIVKAKHVAIRWVILPDGDQVPLAVSDCALEDTLAGSSDWRPGTSQAIVQYDYCDLISEPIAAPVIEGRRYLLWAVPTPEDAEIPAVAPWTAHPQGFLQVRGQGDGEFIYWSGKIYSVKAIRAALAAGQRLPLDQIADPARRLRVAEARLSRRDLGGERAFIQGLLANVLDPEGQAKNVERSTPNAKSAEPFGMSQGENQPHALWYQSLALLRDLGRDEKRRESAVAALTPVAQTARPTIRLAAALALVDLGSSAGKEALIRGLQSESGAISSDPPDTMTFPGRYPYDDSSTTACAHALARLGDRRGLKHPKVEVRLAAADALQDRPDPDLRKALETLSAELQPQVEKLRSTGELARPRRPGDHTHRFPETWVRTQRLLARMGDDAALRRLVQAYIVDAATYPKEETPLVPTGRPTSWSSGPSPGQALHGASESPAHLLHRLKKILGDDPQWNAPALRQLRASLEERPSQESEKPARRKPTETEIANLLADPSPDRRAEGLAAAGYHRIDAFQAKVLDIALNGKGIERNAAIYALRLYDREVPEPVLRRLMASEDVGVRLSAVELATRADAARFAPETMDLVRAQIAHAAKAKSDDWEAQRSLSYMSRIVCRLARGPIPRPLLDGLKDPDPVVRRIVVEAIGLSGNPDAARSIEPLTRDADPATRQASRTALDFLGPAP
jgi:hypothetical protein